MRHKLKHIAVTALSGLLASGCAMLGPDYQQPDAPVGTDWLETGVPRISSEPLIDPRWWESAFRDPELDRLIEMALEENLSLRSAGLRVLQSQQQLAIAIGNQYPQQQQVSGSAAREKADGVTFNDYSVGFNLSWEADFWGRFRRQVESASAQLDASVATYDGVLVSLVAQVAQTYTLIRTFRERLEVARDNIKVQEESVRISRAKFDAGDVSELDVDQAESLLNNTRATATSLEVSLQQFKNSLVILLGRPPQDFNYLLVGEAGIPSVQADIALGMPQDLIRRRPDIRTAERQLAAQSEQIGVAVTDLYPPFRSAAPSGRTQWRPVICSTATAKPGTCSVRFSGISLITGASGAMSACRTRCSSSCWWTTGIPCCRHRAMSKMRSLPTSSRMNSSRHTPWRRRHRSGRSMFPPRSTRMAWLISIPSSAP